MSNRLPAPAAAALLLTLAFAGCTGGGSGDVGGEVPLLPATNEGDADGVANETAPNQTALPSGPVPRTVYLAADGVLANEAPDAGAIPVVGSLRECFALGNCRVLEFVSPPMTNRTAILAEPVTFTIWVKAKTAPVLSNGVFDVGVWFGSTLGVPLFAATRFPGPLLPDAATRVELTFAFDTFKPHAFRSGESLRLLLAVSGTSEGAGVLDVLVGGDTASMVAFTAEDAGSPSAPVLEDQVDETTLTGHVRSPSPDDGGPADASGRHTVSVPEDARFVEVRLRQTAGPRANSDIDMDFFDGTVHVAGSHTPYNHESMFLAGPGLEGLRGRDLTLRVSLFLGAAVDYEVVVRLV